jgi:hypothetical protein
MTRFVPPTPAYLAIRAASQAMADLCDASNGRLAPEREVQPFVLAARPAPCIVPPRPWLELEPRHTECHDIGCWDIISLTFVILLSMCHRKWHSLTTRRK